MSNPNRTTPDVLRQWFDSGVKNRFTHMLVVCDRFSYEDYPVYAESAADCREKNQHHGRELEMSTVEEIYDLGADREEQIAERRASRLPKEEVSK